MKTTRITIKREHTENREFHDTKNCPLAYVLQQELFNPDIRVGTSTIVVGYDRIGMIDPPFERKDFENLKDGKISEFVTEYIPL